MFSFSLFYICAFRYAVFRLYESNPGVFLAWFISADEDTEITLGRGPKQPKNKSK